MNFTEQRFYVIMKQYLINEYVNYENCFKGYKQFDNFKQDVLNHINDEFKYFHQTQQFFKKYKLIQKELDNMIFYVLSKTDVWDIDTVLKETLKYIFIENYTEIYNKLRLV